MNVGNRYLFLNHECGVVNEESLVVLRWYWEKSRFASKIYEALAPKGPWTALYAVIVGKPGWGKTSFAYYALKTGIIRTLCFDRGKFGLEECVEYVEGKYGEICMNKYCGEPDPIDREYRWSFYTGINDLLKFIHDAEKILAEDGGRRRILFLDDLVTTSVYTMGGVWRRAYLAFREITRVARVGASVIIMTATSPTLVPEFIKHSSEYIGVGVHHDFFVYTRFAKVAVPREDGAYEKVLKKVYEDTVPIKAIFGLPVWLENEINERKRQLIRDAARLVQGGGVA